MWLMYQGCVWQPLSRAAVWEGASQMIYHWNCSWALSVKRAAPAYCTLQQAEWGRAALSENVLLMRSEGAGQRLPCRTCASASFWVLLQFVLDSFRWDNEKEDRLRCWWPDSKQGSRPVTCLLIWETIYSANTAQSQWTADQPARFQLNLWKGRSPMMLCCFACSSYSQVCKEGDRGRRRAPARNRTCWLLGHGLPASIKGGGE